MKSAHIALTLIVVSSQIFLVYVEVMVSVQFPEFAINDIEMLIRKIISDLIDVFFLFQKGQGLKRRE